MRAGRALDMLLAEKVMGRDMTKPDGFKYPIGLPRYSTDIAAAWRVVSRMRDVEPRGLLNLHLIEYTYSRTYAAFVPGIPDTEDYSEGNGEHCTPLAICLAALKSAAAVGAPAPAEPHTQET